ncbi:MAG: hypothetical protein ACLQUY_20070 [Ktedonobacterales bacterium]
MSYDNSANAVRRLEERFERLLLILGDLQAAIGRVQQPSYNGAGGQPGGGGGLVYSMVGVVINPAGTPPNYVTGATVNAYVGGTTVALPGTYTVYNQMQAATVITKTIMLGQNPDGTFSVITQSC